MAGRYDNTGGAHWLYTRNWLSNTSVCEWEGIFCDFNHIVVIIQLPNNQLRGYITDACIPEHLESLVLDGNALRGAMPSFEHAKHLRVVTMSDNYLTGSVPSFKMQSTLEVIDLSGTLSPVLLSLGAGVCCDVTAFPKEDHTAAFLVPGPR